MPTLQQRFHAWASDHPDDAIMRWIFRGVVIVTMVVLAADLAGPEGPFGKADFAAPPPGVRQDALPSPWPPIPASPSSDGDKRLLPLPQPDGALALPMAFELVGGGKLMATGTITPGLSEAFAAEVAKRGDYIKTVVLNSPGGSVADALAMGQLIRERKFATAVEAGKYCASSCPLVFAGGVERRADDKAAIGVHQVAAIGAAGPGRDEMSIAQNISARCQRYLGDMGINLQMWVRAMETPHDRLFVFKSDELKSLNIVTATTELRPQPAAPAPKPRS